ncbi:NOL1/NOP2/sun family putative RNA methylase [Clostridium sp. MCC353]|uniref:RsmB/NOP family class I SAM-dependent RNA methyltransferase n=1 Tax=Clostridium sp. MCC353 TaxID=2592646 RepID=UPI001C00EE68|nr:RsmB/NOP family class I SAM-dependent RNA methyltransferase [Clostridium sp. MCC353]MBT9775799.1 NOL1/NOP2/sun family putative RNA methylase [Clostridium sp. MCC353]
MNLPEQFTEQMKELLKDEYGSYINSFSEDRFYGLRVNTGKISPKDFSDRSGFHLQPVAWIPNGFYYLESDRPAKDPYYYAGLYYLQEPSAMTPASLLPVEPGDMVLDLCAAPGGKSTELGARLKGRGMLVANDISNSRAKSLLKNLELLGILNICVTSDSPERLSAVYQEFFDKILVDAPCSGEGMFRKDQGMIKSWLEHGPEYYAPVQKEILLQAAAMLKPGGYLLYSTCTFSVMEDEEVVNWLLGQRPDMELVYVPLWEGASGGIGLDGCVRLFPHKIKGEGHFMALLRKKGAPAEDLNTVPDYKPAELDKLPELKEFLDMVSMPIDKNRLVSRQGLIYYLPQGYRLGHKLRYLRTGLLMGEVKKNRFEPSQALAMALKMEEFQNSLSFAHDDPRVIRYLKGETIVLEPDEPEIKGWCLICVDGYPLGFAKGSGRSMKNKYYPGWRWQ